MTKTSVTPETIAREAVADAAGDFVATGTFLGIGTKISYSTKKVRVLYDVVCEVLKKENLGFKVVPDLTLKKFVFSVYKGKETDVLVSLSGRTAYDMQYTAEKQDLITKSGWYERKLTDMGDWDAINNKPELSNNSFTNAFKFYRIISESYTASGNKIREFGLWCQKGWYLYSVSESGLWEISETKPESVWLYINNGGMTGAKKWDAVLSGTLTKEEAENELLKMTGQETIDSELKGIEYGKDYTLGDILRVQFEFGDFKRTLSKRVYGINVYCDIDKSGIKPVLKSLEV